MDYAVALALAYAGHEKQARALTDELGRRLPEDTVLNVNYMPTLRTRLALNSSNSREALEILNHQSEDFLSGFPRPLEDADPDIPLLKQAKAEYAKLQ